jgi:hypothetical protein
MSDKLKLYTVSDIRKCNPCYDPVERGLCAEDWQGTVVDVLKAEQVPAEDRIWLVSRWLDDRTARLFACWCVRNTPLADGHVVWDLLTDERSRNAVEVAERYADGNATLGELNAARDAARAAAWDAAWDAARDAAWAAALAAALAAAWATAWATARDAAWGSARDSAWDAQIRHLIEMIEG